MRRLLRDVTAAADNAQDANVSTGQAGTASTDEGKVSFKIGDQDIKVTPDELAEWKNAFEKKTTNADKLLQKKSQDLSTRIKQAEAREQRLAQLEETLRASRPQTNAAIVDEFAEMGMDTTDPEVKRAIKVVEKMVEKKLKEREGSEKALSEKVEKIEKNYENLTKAEKAREIQTQAKAIVNSSQLEGEDKQMLMHMFLGKYDVDSMQPDEIMEALQEETKTYEARLKKQGLLKNKEYVDKKTETGKKAGTDVGGTGGRTEADPTLKGLKGREYKNRKEEILMEIANKYLNKSK